MKVCVTGVAGFLGSHLADALLEAGHEVVGCDNMIGGELRHVPKGVAFQEVDCRDLAAMRRLMAGCDLVHHCAATAHEGLSVFAPLLIAENIVSASAAVFSAAVQEKVRRVVFCSSMARYGENQVPFLETYAPKPLDPYGIGKVCAEELLRSLAEVHGLEYCIAVPHNIIGSRQKFDDPYRNVAAIMINLMLQGRQPIIYGDGSQKRCFSFVDDCVFCLMAMGEQNDVLGEVINIGSDEEFVSISELAVLIAGLLDFDLEPIYVEDRPQEVRFANCSADKARRMLGFKTTTLLEDGLLQMIQDIKARGPAPFTYHLDLEILNDKTPKTWSKKLL